MKVSQRERQLALATRSTREDLARMQLIREAEFKAAETRRKRRRRLTLYLAVFLALLAAVFFLLEPALRGTLPEEALSPEKEPVTMIMEDEIRT